MFWQSEWSAVSTIKLKEVEEEEAVSAVIIIPDIPVTLFVFIIFVPWQHETWPIPADMKEQL